MKGSAKLAELEKFGSFGAMMAAGLMRRIEPDAYGSWLDQVSETYEGFMKLGSKSGKGKDAIFGERYSMGSQTKRDAWCYNFSREELRKSVKRLIDGVASRDENIAWSRGLRKKAGNVIAYSDDDVRVSMYRPYVKEYLHFSSETNEYIFQMDQIFPKPDSLNMVICVSGTGNKHFSVLMTDCIPELHLVDVSQSFPLFWYEEVNSTLFGTRVDRRDGISDGMLKLTCEHYGDAGITKEDIFCYIYGVLSSREYALRFGRDTRKVLARVPFAADFGAFLRAGRELG